MRLSVVYLDAVCGGNITIDSLRVVSGLSSLRVLSGVGGGRPLGREGDDRRRGTSRNCSAASFGVSNGAWLDAVGRGSTLLGSASVLGS